MSGEGYWVDLYQARQRLGGGFLVTRRFVLTALHCMRGLSTFDEDLDVVLADGTHVRGRVCRRDKDADLALIEIAAHCVVRQPVPAAGIARGGDRWRGPCRPAENEVELSGRIDSGAVSYLCEGGASIEALQLTADQRLGDYSGYSGGPVETLTQDRRPTVVGILLEQVPDRAEAGRSANVLFAATIREAMQRFDHFDVLHLMDVLRPATREQVSTPPLYEPVAALPPRRQTDRVESVLQAFQQLSDQGVMDPMHVSELRYLALKRVIEDDAGPGAS
ncbi:serine protease [Streptomyces niveus]|uniref:S1 family peptidase n=1 Tax=Streptomyces niveus TaxID=193462 RepID=UPI00386CFB08|nr:serine protease [Streptomyces niveus]